MKKIVFVLALLLSAGAFAQNKDVNASEDKNKVETYEDSKAGFSIQYKPNLWRLFLDKKMIDSTLNKDYAIVKRISGFNQVRVHIIYLKADETIDLTMNKYRDAIVKERINIKQKSRGQINRELTNEEIQKAGCEKGRLLQYIYADKFKEVNTIQMYFMVKGSRIYILETYLEKRTEKEDSSRMKEVVDSFKILAQ